MMSPVEVSWAAIVITAVASSFWALVPPVPVVAFGLGDALPLGAEEGAAGEGLADSGAEVVTDARAVGSAVETLPLECVHADSDAVATANAMIDAPIVHFLISQDYPAHEPQWGRRPTSGQARSPALCGASGGMAPKLPHRCGHIGALNSAAACLPDDAIAGLAAKGAAPSGFRDSSRRSCGRSRPRGGKAARASPRVRVANGRRVQSKKSFATANHESSRVASPRAKPFPRQTRAPS